MARINREAGEELLAKKGLMAARSSGWPAAKPQESAFHRFGSVKPFFFPRAAGAQAGLTMKASSHIGNCERSMGGICLKRLIFATAFVLMPAGVYAEDPVQGSG